MRKIIHCDADCFFVALEMRDDPSLREVPVAVGGDPGRRGVISTCNYEARAFGVHSAMASAYAKRLCPQLIILPHRMTVYRQAAAEMRRIFEDYADAIEPLSLDEAFLDVTHSDHCLGSATLMAQDIRRRIAKSVGITASAGVAGNKFLAKVASDWQKPDGLTVVEPQRTQFFLKHLPVTCIPGVGKASAKKLHEVGITTCDDLQKVAEPELIRQFGKFGRRLYQLSRGDDDRPVRARTFRKSLSVEHTVEQDLVALEQGYPLLETLLDKLQHRLQAMSQRQAITKCFVKLKFSNFDKTTLECIATDVSSSLCRRLLAEAWQRSDDSVRLLGVGVRFSPRDHDLNDQLQLFDV